MAQRDRLKREIEKYVTILRPLSDPKTGGMIDLQEMDAPESSSPTTDKFEKLMGLPENRQAAVRIEYILNEMASQPGMRKFVYVQCLSAAGGGQDSPSLLRNWRAGASEDARLLAAVFDEAVDYIATKYDEYFGTDLKVVVSRDDSPMNSPQDAYHKSRSWRKEDSYMLVGAEVERVMKEEDVGVQAAKGLVAQRESKVLGTPCGFTRVHEAWLHYSKQNKEGDEKAS